MIEFLKKPYINEKTTGILFPLFKKWFFRKFNEFSEPQKYAIYDIHCRNNILISSPTGSGKTLCAFGAILNELIDLSEKNKLEDKVYCVYISPLKALSRDISKNLKEPLEEIEKIAGRKLNLRVGIRTGDTTAAEKAGMLKNPPHVLITTPESLSILLSTKKFIKNLKNVEWCIIDEVHSVAENKRGVHLSLSLERLQRYSPGMCRIGLSATVSPLEDIAKFLVGEERNCKVVDVQYIKQLDLKVLSAVKDLINTDYNEISKKTYELLDELIQQHKTTLIFTNTRSATEKVVHHLKTKFPKNYYEMGENPPETISSLIGAHHGSLSKKIRLDLEDNLKKGKLKTVVCSTSLELGIDIGYIDLVILLGSPKSVARALQRQGRSGHQLHATTKGRIVVLDRDDLVECSVLLKSALEKKIDKLQIPNNCLDVLAQQIIGMALEEVWNIEEMLSVIKKSYCYRNLDKKDFMEVISYLAGEFVSLEDRNIYAKIWYDKESGNIGKRGKMTRVIYMTNIGTIPDQTGVKVKVKNFEIGSIDENFLEKLKPGDVFVLGGETYTFNFARGMVAQVNPSPGKKPTIPSWYSEMLPLSFDLAMNIQKFRMLMEEKFESKMKKTDITDFLKGYLYVDDNAAEAIFNYFYEQFNFIGIPSSKKIIIEHYIDENDEKYAVFHTLFGRRVNDALSRGLAFAISRVQHKDVMIGISDNGFYVKYEKKVQILPLFKMLKSEKFRKVLEAALEKTEILKRRFRYCAGRSLMILRQYKGRIKRVGRQQVSSMILMSAVKRISNDFPILKEARREVLEDLMDVENAISVLKMIEDGKIEINEINTMIPSPFALNLVTQGYADLYKMEDKHEFLKRMHQMVLAKIELKKRKDGN